MLSKQRRRVGFTGRKLMAIPHQSAETPSVTGRKACPLCAAVGDRYNIIRLLEMLDLETRDSADLVFAFEMLRSRNFPVDDLTAWTKRASTYLGRILDDGFMRLAS